MKKKSLAFSLVLLLSLSFAADWQPIALLSVIASISALALIFMVGYALEINELKFLAREELVQVLGTALIIAGFAGTVQFLQATSVSFGGGQDVVTVAKANLSQVNDALSGLNSLLVSQANTIGKEASKSAFCSFGAASFSVAACAGFSMIGGAFPLAFQAIATAAGEIATLTTMVNLGAGTDNVVFTLLFPLGLLLRTFKLTRGAGGLLIAVAVTFYLILPYSIMFTYAAISDTKANLESRYGGGSGAFDGLTTLSASTESCDEYDFGTGNEQREISQLRNFLAEPAGGGPSYIQKVVFQALINSTILLAVVLSVMVASIRALGSMAGADIDVSPLARLL